MKKWFLRLSVLAALVALPIAGNAMLTTDACNCGDCPCNPCDCD